MEKLVNGGYAKQEISDFLDFCKNVKVDCQNKKHLSKNISHLKYASVTEILSEAEKFAKESGVKLEDIKIDACIVDEYGCDTVELSLQTRREKTEKEIKAENRKKAQEKRNEIARRRKQYEDLKKEFE